LCCYARERHFRLSLDCRDLGSGSLIFDFPKSRLTRHVRSSFAGSGHHDPLHVDAKQTAHDSVTRFVIRVHICPESLCLPA
jgi:hypothetical protein